MPASREDRFGVMGCQAHVVIVGGPRRLTAYARDRLAELEAQWSRFLATSEVSRLNDASGDPCRVSADTFVLLTRSVQGWAATGGRFDPTVLTAVEAAGYDRTFVEVRDDPGPVGAAVPAPGCAGIRLDPHWRLVTLPAGVAVDPGGIGKGLAADLVVDELLAAGALGACVNVGGDVRVAGTAPTSEDWLIAIEDPMGGGELDRVSIAAGAVATSSTRLRTWSRAGEPQHHLIDPVTGAPGRGAAAQVTVVAGQGWWAEVVAKAAVLAGGAGADVLAAAGTDGVVVGPDGDRRDTPGFSRFRVPVAEAVAG